MPRLDSPQLSVLRLLTDDWTSSEALAARSVMYPSANSIGNMLGKLTRAGLVGRRTDRNGSEWRLTDAGRAMLATLSAAGKGR